MNGKLFYSAVVLLFAFSVSTSAAADAPQVTTATLQVFDAIKAASVAQRGGASPDVAANLSRISSSSDVLRSRYAKTPEMSDAYRQTLQIDQNALSHAFDPGKDSAGIVAAVQLDLSTKVDNGNGAGSSTSNGPELSVTVTTTLNGAKVVGYLVRLNCRADENASSPEFVFNNPSNPTTTNTMPAGNFVLWLEKNGQHFSRRYVTLKATLDTGPNVPILVDVVPSK